MGRILLLIMGLAVIGYVLKLLVIALVGGALLALLIGLIVNPRRTLKIVLVLFTLGIATKYPIVGLALTAMVVIGVILGMHKKKKAPLQNLDTHDST